MTLKGAFIGGVGRIEDNEVESFIKESKTGVLCFTDGNRPYAVPLEHVYRDKYLYWGVGGTSASRKLNCIKKNNRVCYVIYEALSERSDLFEKKRRCRSLVLEGTVTIIDFEVKKTPMKIARMTIEKTGNWACPSQICPVLSTGQNWHHQAMQRFVDTIATGNLEEMKRLGVQLKKGSVV